MRASGDSLLGAVVRSILAAAAFYASAAAAQQPGSPAQSTLIVADEIVVTAQKREERLQDVPISVTAISSRRLQDSGVRDIKDLTLLTPGLTVTSSSTEAYTTARIRGVGTVGDNPGLESSVGVVIDGVYRPRNGVGFGDLGELERIEVLKGPQGTLFGKNTSAGVISVVTARPEFDFKSNVELTAGNYGTLDGSASVTGPLLGETVAGRFHVVSRNRDGFHDVSTGSGPRGDQEDGDREATTARGQLLIRAADGVDVRLIGDYARREESCCLAAQVALGGSQAIIDALTPDAGVVNPANAFDRNVFANRSTGQSIRDAGISAEVTGYFGEHTLTSLTAWRNWEAVNGQESDYTSVDIIYREDDSDYFAEFGQFSQELRLAGQTPRFNWVLGGFFAAEDLDAGFNALYGTQFEPYYGLLFSQGVQPNLISLLNGLPAGTSFAGGQGARDMHEQQSDTYALFTNNTYSLTQRADLTLGLRYTIEEKTLDSMYTNTDGGVGCATARQRFAAVNATLPTAVIPSFYNLGCSVLGDPVFNNLAAQQTIDESEWSGTTKLAYRFTDHVMSYVSYARGYKASGFNLDRERTQVASTGAPVFAADTDTRFRPEIVDSYELGSKTTWLERSLLLNAAAFYQQLDDFQLNTFTGVGFVVMSIPEVKSRGVDFDFIWLPPRGIRNFSMQGGITYADTRYGTFTPTFVGLARLPNNQVSFAPKWSGSLSVTYDRPIRANLIWRGNIGAKATSRYNTGSDLNPGKDQDAYTLVNARIGLGPQDERWMIEAWSQNLTDEEYAQVIFDATYQQNTLNAFLGAPRTYGLTLRMQF
jgi:outer membrane receptor protein involved in Fe transport